MKVIDLLNTPLNELPQKVKIEDKTYTLFIDEDTGYHYYQDDKCEYFMFSISCFDELNDEIEIIEEDKKIEKIPIGKYHPTHRIKKIEKKINEIIDYINKEKE